MNKIGLLCAFPLLLYLIVCSSTPKSDVPSDKNIPVNASSVSNLANSSLNDEIQQNEYLKITFGDHELTATFTDNSSADALKELLAKGPITIDMHDYGQFEKVGELGTNLPRNDEQITTVPGDVILYQGTRITIYYDTNSWNFTRIATIDDITDLKTKLGEGNVLVTFTLEER